MGLDKFFKKQLSSVIEWKSQNKDIVFYRYPSITDEVKNASKLIVAPGQGCIIVYGGKIVDTLTEEGTFFLKTDNHPFITNLLKIHQAFESEHKMRFYFFRTAEIVNQKWGTASPIKYMDAIYKFPIELGAYGNYSIRLADAENIFANLVGAKDFFSTEDLRHIVVSRIISELTTYLAKATYSYQEIDSYLSDISVQLKESLQSIFRELGLSLTDFRIEATSFDEGTIERIGKIADMTSETLAASEAGLSYVELEKLRVLRDAAQNEGGIAGAGLQLGAGLELGKTFVSEKGQALPAGEIDDVIMQLKKLKMLLDENILTEEEFNQKKKDVLDKI